MAPNPKTHLCPIRRRTQREHDVKTQTLEEGGYVKAEPEIGVMLQTGDALEDTGRHKEGFSPRELDGAWPC